MRCFGIILLLLNLNIAFSQSTSTGNNRNNLKINKDLLNHGQMSYLVTKLNSNLNEIESNSNLYSGSLYLFKNWDNSAIVIIEGKKYKIPNTNYNIHQEQFISKIGKDSVFVLNFEVIDKIIINDKSFVSLYNNDDNKNKIYEIVYRDKNFSILRTHSLTLSESRYNPALGSSEVKIKLSSVLNLYNEGLFSQFKFKKKSILNLVEDRDKEMIEDYVKSNKLSYKKEEDVKMILRYYNTLIQ